MAVAGGSGGGVTNGQREDTKRWPDKQPQSQYCRINWPASQSCSRLLSNLNSSNFIPISMQSETMSAHRNPRKHPYQQQHSKSTVSLSRSASLQENAASSISLIDVKVERLKKRKADFDLQLKSMCGQVSEMIREIESLRARSEQLFHDKMKHLLRQSKRSKYHHNSSSRNKIPKLSDTSSTSAKTSTLQRPSSFSTLKRNSSFSSASLSSSSSTEHGKLPPPANKLSELEHLTVDKIGQLQTAQINSFIDLLFKEATVQGKPSRVVEPSTSVIAAAVKTTCELSVYRDDSHSDQAVPMVVEEEEDKEEESEKSQPVSPQVVVEQKISPKIPDSSKQLLLATIMEKPKSPDDDLEATALERMSFANRRNMWERRSLGRSYKFRPAKSIV